MQTTPPAGQTAAARMAGALTLAFGLCVLSAGCLAAAVPSLTLPELRTLLATNTDVLSETAMGAQTGSGLKPPAVISNEPGGPAKVLLWDEMRMAPILNPPNNGVVTGGNPGR
jgi:hypothetical protein